MLCLKDLSWSGIYNEYEEKKTKARKAVTLSSKENLDTEENKETKKAQKEKEQNLVDNLSGRQERRKNEKSHHDSEWASSRMMGTLIQIENKGVGPGGKF
jgi:hypothetical protein